MAYKYLFFKLYKLASSLDYNNKAPEYTATFGISTLVFLNYFFIASLADHFNLTLLLFQSVFTTIAVSLLILFINFILIFRIIGIDKIDKQFSNINRMNEIRYNIYILIYIIATFILFCFSFSLIRVV